jgi:hypothetical protein
LTVIGQPPAGKAGGEVLGLAYSVRAFRVAAAGSPVRATHPMPEPPVQRGRINEGPPLRVGYPGRSRQVDLALILNRQDMRIALAQHDIATVFRILQRHGIPQRKIAAWTDQSQSEIWEIMNGRKVYSYDVLVRIADGLGVPRGMMGLAYDEPTTAFLNDLSAQTHGAGPDQRQTT